jgi:hypothetical protein
LVQHWIITVCQIKILLLLHKIAVEKCKIIHNLLSDNCNNLQFMTSYMTRITGIHLYCLVWSGSEMLAGVFEKYGNQRRTFWERQEIRWCSN